LIAITVVTGLIEVLILGIVIAVIYKAGRSKYDDRSISY
jgi:hypothetical protein